MATNIDSQSSNMGTPSQPLMANVTDHCKSERGDVNNVRSSAATSQSSDGGASCGQDNGANVFAVEVPSQSSMACQGDHNISEQGTVSKLRSTLLSGATGSSGDAARSGRGNGLYNVEVRGQSSVYGVADSMSERGVDAFSDDRGCAQASPNSLASRQSTFCGAVQKASGRTAPSPLAAPSLRLQQYLLRGDVDVQDIHRLQPIHRGRAKGRGTREHTIPLQDILSSSGSQSQPCNLSHDRIVKGMGKKRRGRGRGR